jgi:hypothetical protein
MLGHSKFKLTDLEKDKTLVLMQGRVAIPNWEGGEKHET